MSADMILVRVTDEAREGWNWMPLDEFLERIDLAVWESGQELVGVVLPPSRRKPPQ